MHEIEEEIGITLTEIHLGSTTNDAICIRLVAFTSCEIIQTCILLFGTIIIDSNLIVGMVGCEDGNDEIHVAITVHIRKRQLARSRWEWIDTMKCRPIPPMVDPNLNELRR